MHCNLWPFFCFFIDEDSQEKSKGTGLENHARLLSPFLPKFLPYIFFLSCQVQKKKAHISYGLFSKSSYTKQELRWRNSSNLNLPSVIHFLLHSFYIYKMKLVHFKPVDTTTYTRIHEACAQFLLLLVSSSWSQDPVKEPDRENAEFVATSFQMLSCTNSTESHFYNNAYAAKMPSYINTLNWMAGDADIALETG